MATSPVGPLYCRGEIGGDRCNVLGVCKCGTDRRRACPKALRTRTAILDRLAFNALFGILVIPSATYLLGFITFATLYGAVSVDCALYDELSLSPVSKLLRAELASPGVGHTA